MARMRDEAAAAHKEFAGSCGTDGHGMAPVYNPNYAKPRGVRLGPKVRMKPGPIKAAKAVAATAAIKHRKMGV